MTKEPQEKWEDWKSELRKQYVKVYQGELHHGIHGVLLDPEKLESFIRQQIKQAGDEGYVRRGIMEAEIKAQLIKDGEQKFQAEHEKGNKEIANAIEMAKSGWIEQGAQEERERLIEKVEEMERDATANPMQKRLEDELVGMKEYNQGFNQALSDVIKLLKVEKT